MNPRALSPATTFTPAPDPLLGPLLRRIDDLGELKCILRALWHMNQKTGPLRYVTKEELASDDALAGLADAETIERGMTLAARLGLFAKGPVTNGGRRVILYVLNDDSQRMALMRAMAGKLSLPEPLAEPLPPASAPSRRPNIITIYEQEIGMLTPIIAEELERAEEEFPLGWIAEALREAARSGKRSWRYALAILERWKREGRAHGEFGRDSKALDPGRYLEDYVQRRGRLPGG